MKKSIALVWFLTIATLGQSQTLLNELVLDKPETTPPAFKAMKVANLQSTKTASKGNWSEGDVYFGFHIVRLF